ncbi:MAG: NADH-quinone oxidoreductase subunit C, partial [Nitrosopumilales archaeon CG_4_9_14_0_2_um_filter_34_16]
MSAETENPPADETPVESMPPPAVKKPEEKPVDLPAFEKNISDKIVEKFGDKVEVGFVKEDRVRINVGRENVHDVAEFIRDGLNYDHVE